MALQVDIKKALDDFVLDVSFDVGDETVGLLGASGCGKSLTMRCIAGIETPDEGRIVVNDKVFFDSDAKINLSPQERKTALLFQNYMLFPHMTVEQNVGAGIGRDVPVRERSALIRNELDRFDIAALAKRYPAALSGGQQQRVALARMLAARPDILMLDEPFAALDSHLKSILEQNLVSLFDAFSGSVIYVSHDIDEAMRFCDRIAVVEAGRIAEVATGRDLVERPQSLAGIKISGCTNAHKAKWAGEHRIFCDQWGVGLRTSCPVPRDVRAFGVREFDIERVDQPGPSVYRVCVDRISDARFERTALLRFLDRADEVETVYEEGRSIGYLRTHLVWRLGLDCAPRHHWPEVGEELLVRIPPEKVILVSR